MFHPFFMAIVHSPRHSEGGWLLDKNASCPPLCCGLIETDTSIRVQISPGEVFDNGRAAPTVYSRGQTCRGRKTSAKRRRPKRQEGKDALRRRRPWPIPQRGAWRRRGLPGHGRDDGVPRNGSLLAVFRDRVLRYWGQTCHRRQRPRTTWPRLDA